MSRKYSKLERSIPVLKQSPTPSVTRDNYHVINSDDSLTDIELGREIGVEQASSPGEDREDEGVLKQKSYTYYYIGIYIVFIVLAAVLLVSRKSGSRFGIESEPPNHDRLTHRR
jgi:hypothetical protein